MSDDPQLELIKEKLEKMIATEKKAAEPFPVENIDSLKSKLSNLSKLFSKEYEFSKGQFIKWKPSLKNKHKPRINEPAIVISLLDTPVYDKDKDSGSPYFLEPLDMVIGILEEDHDTFMLFYVDRRRFMPL